jgi:hypothetical protein
MVISYQNGNCRYQNGNKPPLIIRLLTPLYLYSKRTPPLSTHFSTPTPSRFLAAGPPFLGFTSFLWRWDYTPTLYIIDHNPKRKSNPNPSSIKCNAVHFLAFLSVRPYTTSRFFPPRAYTFPMLLEC